MSAKLSLLALLATMLLPVHCFAQMFDYGGQSEATRQLNRFQAQGSVDAYTKRVIQRDRTVNSGFGAPRVSDPGVNVGSSPAQPPRAQSASFGVGTAGASGAKPFAGFSPSPTVSPYLNLFRETLNGEDDLNYQTIVRPQLQQERFNSQVRRQEMQVNQELTALSARNAYNVTGNQQVAPTGHSATFQNYSRFYPAKSQRRRR
ncbi:hypothetical protein NG895_24180 [Aeoliella sp. ICT_H6.2]|uniref:Uncharacterized protein n=1 Tax=Aeoliella straminimaris TaxID=2954799 RepID=A0A9X2JKP3_9BACT|nr:hypothetical protein [Aeoliella straminimaris]MCO6047009.1 hypothetical protein [Aeoliella straminimaris]